MQKFLPLGLAVIALFITSAASAYTQEEQGACIGDAFQLCFNAIPDENRVKACLIANVQRLSPGCRRLFYVSPPARRQRAAG
jgi:hypothetical protein